MDHLSACQALVALHSYVCQNVSAQSLLGNMKWFLPLPDIKYNGNSVFEVF